MIKAFASPSSYVQGKGVLFQSKLYLESFGTKPLLITGGHVYEAVGKDFEAYLTKQGFDVILMVNLRPRKSTGSPRSPRTKAPRPSTVSVAGRPAIRPRRSPIPLSCRS